MKSLDNNDKKRMKIYDVHHLWKMYVENKRCFALSIFFCLLCGILYIYFAHPAYSVTGKVLVTEKKNSSNSASATAALLSNQLPLGLGSSLGGSIGVENEKEILGSKLLARNVVNKLGLYKEYRIHSFLKGRLVYKNQPIDVAVTPHTIQLMEEALPLKNHSIKLSVFKSGNGFRVEGMVRSGKKKTELPEQSFSKLPCTVKTSLGDLTLSENKNLTEDQQKPYKKDYRMDVLIIPPTTAALKLSKRLAISTASKKATNTVNLAMKDESILRGYDYINCLVEEYNTFSTEEKHKEVSKYDQFVKERLAMVDRDLGLNDEDWEKYKKHYQVTDLRLDAEELMGKKSTYESQLVNFGIQQQLLDYLSEYVNDPANLYELIPVNVGVYSGDAVSMISRHNELVSSRKMLLKSVTEQSTQVKLTTQLIDELHPVIQTALKRDRESLILRKRVAEREYNKSMSRVSVAPEQERALTEVGRQRKVKEGVYLSLLQKREENAMDLINSVDKGRLIDMVQYKRKVKPRVLIVLALSLVMGVLLPFVVISLRRWLRGTIKSVEDLEGLTMLPILGEVPYDETHMDEAFICIRSNLLHHLGHNRKVILVTSDDQGDGKTYHAIRLAKSLSETGKRVVICDLNFRNPSVSKEFGMHQGTGLGQLLVNDDLTKEKVMSVLVKSTSSQFDVLVAGESLNIHPANLLARGSLEIVMDILKQSFDFVVLDTPAIGKYSDVLIDGLADVTYYICCSGKTPKTSVVRLNQLEEENRLISSGIVINHLHTT